VTEGNAAAIPDSDGSVVGGAIGAVGDVGDVGDAVDAVDAVVSIYY
jgi:hypothetical protein